jgi:putative nucleotidyltransferase with HDIG domain
MGLALNLVNRGESDSKAPQAASADQRASVRIRHTARILVVDDEASVRSMIGATLERHGFDVQLAVSGSQAVEILGQATFDLILTDIVMQDGNGIALLERIHSDQPHLPVVMVSAIHDISVAIDSMRRGAYDYLLKPFEREHLVATVQRALDHRHALQESHSYQQNLEQVVRARTEMLRQAMEDLEHSYDVTLEALGDALDLKDSETEGHSKRVTAYTIALARAMEIPPAEIKVIARGAFLHDIGKMAIPDEILRKPGKLTPEEEEVMRDHCTRGYHILRTCARRPQSYTPTRSTSTGMATRAGCAAMRFPLAQESLPSLTQWTRSRATGRIVKLAALTRRERRSCAAPGRSLTPRWSKFSSKSPMSCGTNCGPRSMAKIAIFRHSISRALPYRRVSKRDRPKLRHDRARYRLPRLVVNGFSAGIGPTKG